MRKRAIEAVIAAFLAFAAAACGGKVVINENELGQGGSGDTSAGAGLTCSWPEPVGSVVSCGAPLGGECGQVFCDKNGNTYEAACSDQTCKCNWNGMTKCTCSIGGSGSICDGSAEPCCPAPIP